MKSIKENFVWNTLLKVSTIIFPLIVFPYISRTIGADGIGKVSFATSVVSYFSIIAQLGIPTYGIRSVAQVKDNQIELSKRIHEILVINLCTTILAYLLFAVSLLFVDKLRADSLLFIIISLELGFGTIGMIWLFSGLEQYAFITKRSLFFKLISLILVFLFVHEKEDYLVYATILVISNVGSNIINYFYARKFVSLKKQVGQYNYRRHIKPIITFFSMSVATTVYTSLDTVMLGFMTNDYQVGYYSAAIKIRSVLLGVVNSLATVLLPKSSYYVKENKMEEFIDISQKAFNFVFLIGMPLWIYFSLFAKESILILSGSGFLEAINPMLVIMPTVFICGISNLTAIQMLVALNKEKVVLKSQVLGAIIDLMLNALFIPQYGAVAAAGATTFAEFVIMIIQVKELHKCNIYISKSTSISKIVLAILLAFVGSIWLFNKSIHPFWVLIASATVFFGIYYVVLTITKETMTVMINNTLFSIIRRIICRVKKC